MDTRAGEWSRWAPTASSSWTIGVEEEVMLLDPSDWALASEADMVVEVSHDAHARIPAEHVRGRGGSEEVRIGHAVDLRADEAQATDNVRPDTFALSAADRHADDDVAHQVQDAVIAEVVLRAEEARVVPEVHFPAHDASAHAPGADAEGPAAVVEAAPEG